MGWYRTHGRLHTGDPVAMAADALDAYLADRAAGKDALLVCDTWEIADALNRRLHDTLTADGPAAQVDRDQTVRVGDIIVSRDNDAPIDVRPGADRRRPTRSGPQRQPLAGRRRRRRNQPHRRRTAHRKARVVFDGDYLREHVTSATRSPCTPPRASPPTPHTPSSAKSPPAHGVRRP